MIAPGSIFLHDALAPDGESLLFTSPIEELTAFTPAEALAALDRIETARAEGYWIAGYFAYELGLLFEERLRPLLQQRPEHPLLWLGLYRAPRRLTVSEASDYIEAEAQGLSGSAGQLALDMDIGQYGRAFDAIKAYIGAGDAYQVNLTFQARFTLDGDAVALYRDLALKQPVAYGALVETGAETILSRSPELFVESRNGRLSARPMKGTLARGRTVAEDEAGVAALAGDPKSRAENLMIVDLLRNDLSRISEIGSVTVTDLFTVETYRTLHQMTSGITARMKPEVTPLEAIRNLFPCGSVTGAPKIRAMEIIRELESGPRGVYTGSIGYIAPSGDFRFNVAIRTAVIGKDGQGKVGIGSGIVADSELAAEYNEALLKLKFLTDPVEPVALIETMLWEQDKGFWLLDRHVERLLLSARYFNIAADEASIRRFVQDSLHDFSAPRMRVRLVLHERDGLSVTAVPLPEAENHVPFRFILAEERVNSNSPLLFHKTTNRAFYDEPRKAAAARHGVDEVVFRNERDELTEGSITSIFIEHDGQLFTPALQSGLLPGTLRAELLSTGRAREAVLTAANLQTAEKVFLGNSVRGLMAATLVTP
ncbi:MAG TPA: aminodeoxychorismate synthase component I [Devosiaceae bacterium]|nr:aminodeoxychorismate synthase component I [Devosiaceae bacterium]